MNAIPWQLRETTSNRKLGPHTSVVTLGRQSCPDACPLREAGCYADSGPLSLHWDKVTDGSRANGVGFRSLALALKKWNRSHRNSLIRIGDAGQITDSEGFLSRHVLSAVQSMRIEDRGNQAIIYVHPGEQTCETVIRIYSDSQTAINVSRHGTNISYDPDIPQVTTVPRGTFSEGRRKVGDIVQCPAEYRGDVNCDTCRLCALPGRRCVVGFTAHGVRARKVDEASR